MNVRILLTILSLGLLAASPIAYGAANCDALQSQLSRKSLNLAALEQKRNALDNLIQGQIPDDFVLADTVDAPLDMGLELVRAKLSLEKQLAQESTLLQVPPDFEGCPEQQAQWLGLEKQLRSQQQIINQHLLHLYQLPRNSRLALVRETTQWQTLNGLQSEVANWSGEHTDLPAAQAVNEEITNWINYWRGSTRIWLGQLLASKPQGISTNEVWTETLQVPHPASAINWNPELPEHINAESDAALLDWLDTLEEAHRALLRESGKWRNQHIWSLGWLNFFRDMSHPSQFWPQLKTEIRSAPTNLIDAVTRPFIREYRRAIKQDKRGEMLSSWFLQILALIAIMSALLKLAAFTPQLLSLAQQKLLISLQNRGLIQFNAALLWFIKPNAPWVVVLLGANGISRSLPESWIILNWLAPIGSLYAAFRAARVILEWVISRTFTRSGQFVSSHMAQQQAADAHRVAWVFVMCFLSWVLVKGTGGGYLMFFTILIIAAIVWGTMTWLLRRYSTQVARFLLYAAGKGTNKKLDPQQAQRWWMLPVWPALFAVAQVSDIIVHLHQKLLIFDTYRSTSVKLIRIRLAAEARDEDATQEDDTLPDESYSDWMLRNNKTWIEAYDISNALKPLQNWQKEKSEDNVLLVVGDQGSGKTALINRLTTTWTDTPISVLNIPAKTTDPAAILPMVGSHLCIPNLTDVAQLVKMDETLEPQIIVLDNTHNLFLSEVGCLDAYRALNQCLNAHLRNIFWIVVMHAPSWSYLNCVFNREVRFSNIFRMPRWSPADIRKLILSRHQGSRRRIRYDELLLSASAGSESSSVRAADSRVFNILWEQSGGIPQVAIQLWLAAARSKEQTVELGVPGKPSGNALKDMKDDLCFVFSAIVTHKSLSSEEIMLVTHFPEAIVRHTLKQGLNLGLLWRDDTKRYRIHPSWQGTLNGFLISKNLQWEL